MFSFSFHLCLTKLQAAEVFGIESRGVRVMESSWQYLGFANGIVFCFNERIPRWIVLWWRCGEWKGRGGLEAKGGCKEVYQLACSFLNVAGMMV